MADRIRLFQKLEIETCAMCNRFCETCLRNSVPDRESVASWFEDNYLHEDVVRRILQESWDLGFRGEVCLSHYNEPLMDPRIVNLVQIAKDIGYSYVFFGSNGDFLTEELAADLDGLVDYIGFSFYMDEPKKSERMAWVRGLFKKSKITLGKGDHMVTHFSPNTRLLQLIKNHVKRPCHLPQKRLIINHRGQMLMCCEDLVGNFDLGSIHDSNVEDLWYSEKHQKLVRELERPGGRGVHPHCVSCPRP